MSVKRGFGVEIAVASGVEIAVEAFADAFARAAEVCILLTRRRVDIVVVLKQR